MRLTEENDVVIAEGSVRTQRKAGGILSALFCDVFVMQRGKIMRLITYFRGDQMTARKLEFNLQVVVSDHKLRFEL